ncbi:MAG: GGDEF domain-containing protein [Pyrinomonadaceae bacterium]|nr:GGDEF domain-containing protein [Pyrinomonadaceae bacterium]
MNHPIDSVPAGVRRSVLSPAAVIVVALGAIGASYIIAIADLEIGGKTRGFSAIIAAFLVITVGLYLLQNRRRAAIEQQSDVTQTFEHSLSALDEAKDIFAGSLSAADLFRLATSRIRGLVPCKTLLLFVYDAAADRLTVEQAEGSEASQHRGLSINPRDGQPGECYCSRRVETGPASVAIPLETGHAPFGVLQLFFDKDFDPQQVDRSTFEAIGVRIAPLVMSSVAFEQSHTTALTDSTTDLPNERAFHLVLENQTAESQRKPDERPLTILALDIRGFDDINQRFGHAAGDRVLAFVAGVVKENLRQMDFFARAAADEFLVVLPTATKEVSHEIIARIHTGFFGRKLKLTEADSLEVEISVGWAAFGTDGETPDTLLRAARERKAQSKSPNRPKVIWFPAELAN